MRILKVIISTPENMEGAVRAGMNLANHLDREVTVDVVKMSGDSDEKLVNEVGMNFGMYNISSIKFMPDFLDVLNIDTQTNFENSLIFTYLDPPSPLHDYDVVHIHNSIPIFALVICVIQCRLKGVPYVFTTHEISKIYEWPEYLNMGAAGEFLFKQVYLRLYESVIRGAEHIISLSNSDKETLRKKFPNQDVSVIPNGVSFEKCDNEVDVESVTGRPILLFVGKIIESKGVLELINAVDGIKHDFSLFIVGPESDPSLVAEIENNCDDRIRFEGYVSKNRLRQLYQFSDIFVFPTKSDVFPLVTLEAMAAGTPVISTSVGGIPEQITPETGILINPGNTSELTNAINKLLIEEEMRLEMGKNARDRATNEYSWRSVANDTINVYRTVID
ncbi:glycosyltransferase family 4 protein [Salinigranum marinum]|uniref:glycosyltransferase family 4 protein n=1 Tax=Salinigranum marinum TaxID=1515595 RepID=UPI00298A06AA|nr:glycosyltransferase family 4 protein [Salinigranum marinum]